jgi:t-SNARE complex subunit (syntaxin)
MSSNPEGATVKDEQEQAYTKYKNPFCSVEAEASMKCMADHGHVREKCLEVFQQYRDCKKNHREEEREKIRKQPFF